VPTQVVTEYVRSAKFANGHLDGIRYRSSRRAGISLVLFADKTNVVGACTESYARRKSNEWLELVDRTETAVSQALFDTIAASTANAAEDDE